MRKLQFDRIAQARDDYLQAWNAYEALPKESEVADLWQKTKQAVNVGKEENDKFFALFHRIRLGISSGFSVLVSMEKSANFSGTRLFPGGHFV